MSSRRTLIAGFGETLPSWTSPSSGHPSRWANTTTPSCDVFQRVNLLIGNLGNSHQLTFASTLLVYHTLLFKVSFWKCIAYMVLAIIIISAMISIVILFSNSVALKNNIWPEPSKGLFGKFPLHLQSTKTPSKENLKVMMIILLSTKTPLAQKHVDDGSIETPAS